MNQLCKVCSEPAAGYHFGAFTCEGCKSFFGRTYNNLGALGECKNNGQCVINKKNRTSCKSCRLKKCLVVGMSKSGSRYGRRSNWFKIHCLIQDQADLKNRIKEDGMTEDTTDEAEGMTEDLMTRRENLTRDSMFQSDLIASHAHLLQQQKQYRNSLREKHDNNNSGPGNGAAASAGNSVSGRSDHRSVNNNHHHNHHNNNHHNNNHHHNKSLHQRKSSGSPSSSSTISSNSPPSSNSSKELLAVAAAAAAAASAKGSINPFSHLMGLHPTLSPLHPQHQHLMNLAMAATSAGNHNSSKNMSSGSPALSSSSTTSSNNSPPNNNNNNSSKEQLLAAAAAAFNPFSHLMMHHPTAGSGHHVSSSLHPHPADFMSMAAAAAALASGKGLPTGGSLSSPASSASPTFSNFSPQSASSATASKEFFAAAAAAALKPFSHLFMHPSHHVSAQQMHQHQADLMSAAAAAAISGKMTPASMKLSSSSGKLTPGSLSDIPEQEKPIDLSIKTEDDEEENPRTRSCSPADSFDSDIEVSAY